MQTENHYTETDLGNVSPNPRGNYDNAVKYEYLDLVTMQGGSYLCVIPVGQTITGTAPEPGATTEYWQCLAMPGDRTPEYIEAHDKVVRLAKEVAQNTTKVAEDKQSVAQMETDVRQLKEQTAESARQAESSKDSAAGSARVAKTAEDNIRQVANNVNTLVNGFDTHVAEKTTEATQAVATAKDNAVQAVERQETASVQEVKDQTATYITEQKNLAKQELDDKVNQFGLDVNVIKAEVSKEGQKQITNVQEATTAELAKITEKGTEQAGIVTTEGEKQVQAVQAAAQKIIADREQITKNKTDIAELRQKKADAIVESVSGTLLNVKDSSGAFFEDFSMSGKTVQNGTPTPDTPVEIVNAGEDGNIEIKVTGKNLIPFPYPLLGGVGTKGTKNGITWEVLKDRGIKISGTATDYVYVDLLIDEKLQDRKKYAYSKDLLTDNRNGKILYAPYTTETIDELYYPQVEHGANATAYEPYRQPQAITLSLDRPLTKWDKLEKREGVWGIARQGETKVLKAAPEEKWEVWEDKQNAFFIVHDKKIKEGLCSHFEAKGSLEIGKETGIYLSETARLIVTDMNINSLESWKTWLQANPITVTYKTAEEIWEPLPEETQKALNTLHTNYPTTVVTNSEDTEMQLTYIADTKNYHLGREEILQKQILEIQNALISQKISGGGIKVTNSAKLPIAKLSVFGKSEQITTTGANLFNALTITEKHWLNTENGNIEPASTFWTSDFIEVEEGDYCLTEKGTNRNCGYDEGKNFVKALLASKGKITVTSGIKFIRVSGVYETIKPNNLMINRGPTTKPYEPYTGGKPSPSTEYPQEITSCGDKGTIEIKVTGKNLIPFPYPAISGNKGTKNGITWEVLTDGGIRLQGTASTAFYLDLDNNLKIGNTLIAPGNTDGKIAVNKDVTYNGDIAKVYIAVVKGMTVNRVYYPQIEYGTISTSYEPYREPQELTLPTQNGLPGLKVDGNGNYTDETGQQWIADEIDLARGKYVQRIARRMFDGNEQLGDDLGGKTSLWLRVDNIRPETGLCNYGKIVKANTIEQEELSFSVSSSGIYLYTTKTAVEFKNLLKQKYDSGKPVEVLYALKTPIETDLPPETISAFKKLHTNYPTTIVSNNAEAGMELTYTVDTQSYVDSKIAEINMQVVNTQKQLLQERSK